MKTYARFIGSFFGVILVAAVIGLFAAGFSLAAGGFTGTGQAADGNAGRPGGGFTGPGPALVTVKQAREMRDDTHVTLRGKIVQHLGKDKYLFKDETGSIHVEIDDDEWMGQTVSPDDTVELYGEVDKDWNSVEIDVKRLTKK